MKTQDIINEANKLEIWDPVFDAIGIANVNAGDTVGPQYSMTNVSDEYAQAWIGTVRGMLCDPSSYGIGEEVIAWFAARGIKG